ncbi:MAG TPA: hypothetical protein VMU16_13860 [Candidatus Binataceae bacterium]|nr:hypothetical protein [Candidatus Binataceae bacterium]
MAASATNQSTPVTIDPAGQAAMQSDSGERGEAGRVERNLGVIGESPVLSYVVISLLMREAIASGIR